MNEEKILKETEEFVRNKLPKSRLTNDGSPQLYFNHVFGVRKYALILAKKYNANKFIVEMAALLHDVGADAGAEHAHESAKISQKFLSKLDMPNQIKEEIIACIETHSMGSKAEGLESQIIQDADGMIFIEDSWKDYFEGAKEEFPLEEAKKLTSEKVTKMMNKIKTEEGIKFAKKFLENTLKIINRH